MAKSFCIQRVTPPRNLKSLAKSNPYLVVDTALYPPEFQADLLSELSLTLSDGLDNATDGLLIHSDNFQALNLLQTRYREQVKCIYIDPPYNTSASEIIYKNGYKHSSWLSLIENRISKSKTLLRKNGIHCLTIDDFEYHKVKQLLDDLFSNYYLGTIAIKNNPSGRSTTTGVSIAHEYALFHTLNESTNVGRLGRTEEQISRYKEQDEKGAYEWVNFRKHGGTKEDAPSMYYPIFINTKELTFRIPKMLFNKQKSNYELADECAVNEITVYPIDENGTHRRWKWGLERFSSQLNDICIKKDKAGNLTPYIKSRMNETGVLPLTIWDKKEYSSTSYGTNVLKNIMGDLNAFSYPKSIHAVEDALRVLNLNSQELALDYFAGSGTTAHAVINLNREDNGNRQYILVEQGEYFDTVLKPRVQKVIYSKAWKEGKPVAEDKAENLQGVPQIVKVLKLESYEDTLNNLELRRSDLFDSLSKDVQQDYLLNYMLNLESRGSLLNVSHFEKPFDYGLNISTISAGAYEWQKVDLVETFNYLIGAKVIGVDDKRTEQGFVAIECHLPNQSADEKTLIFWRDCERVGYDGLQKQFDRLGINPADSEYSQVYVNGDHTLETVWDGEQSGSLKIISIEDAFLSLMFEGEA